MKKKTVLVDILLFLTASNCILLQINDGLPSLAFTATLTAVSSAAGCGHY